MRVKIQNKAQTLCTTCASSTVIETSRNIIVKCAEVGGFLSEPVQKCNSFTHRNEPSEWEMQKIAWQIRTDTSGKVLGFTPPQKKEK